MTAAKRPTGASVWHSRPHRLSDTARAELIAALGFPADSQDPKLIECLKGVEHWLGFYPGGKEAIDNAPSAKVYVSELETLRETALTLSTLLNTPYKGINVAVIDPNDHPAESTLLNSPDKGINPFTWDTLSEHCEKVGVTGAKGKADATSASMVIVAACDSALKEWQPKTRQETRGQKKSGSREVVLTQLLELYRRYSKPRAKKRMRKGLAETLSEFEVCELGFVRAAFKDIGADNFSDARGNEKWRDLIRQARSPSPANHAPGKRPSSRP